MNERRSALFDQANTYEKDSEMKLDHDVQNPELDAFLADLANLESKIESLESGSSSRKVGDCFKLAQHYLTHIEERDSFLEVSIC